MSCNGHDSSTAGLQENGVTDHAVTDRDKADPLRNVVVDGSGRKFVFSVAVIDWDPKPLERISKYYFEDGEIVTNYLRHASSGEQEKHDLGLDS